MTRLKISATVDPDLLANAREVTGLDNTSELFDRALDALVERELETRWLERHRGADLPDDTPVDLGDLPWDPA
jgi:post-segregation antitoxin (ccd killing protein)